MSPASGSNARKGSWPSTACKGNTMIRNLRIEAVTIAGVSGWQVQGIFRACSDSLWEPIAHAAVFAQAEYYRAEKLLARIRSKPSWEWKGKGCWGVPVGNSLSKIDAIQQHVCPYTVLPAEVLIAIRERGKEAEFDEYYGKYRPGQYSRSSAGAPGIGHVVYVITGTDERGLWGRQIENTIRIGTMADFA